MGSKEFTPTQLGVVDVPITSSDDPIFVQAGDRLGITNIADGEGPIARVFDPNYHTIRSDQQILPKTWDYVTFYTLAFPYRFMVSAYYGY